MSTKLNSKTPLLILSNCNADTPGRPPRRPRLRAAADTTDELLPPALDGDLRAARPAAGTIGMSRISHMCRPL